MPAKRRRSMRDHTLTGEVGKPRHLRVMNMLAYTLFAEHTMELRGIDVRKYGNWPCLTKAVGEGGLYSADRKTTAKREHDGTPTNTRTRTTQTTQQPVRANQCGFRSVRARHLKGR